MSVPVVEWMRLLGKISKLNSHFHCTYKTTMREQTTSDYVSPSVVEGLLEETSEVIDVVIVVASGPTIPSTMKQ